MYKAWNVSLFGICILLRISCMFKRVYDHKNPTKKMDVEKNDRIDKHEGRCKNFFFMGDLIL
jgi:hypothetical protein